MASAISFDDRNAGLQAGVVHGMVNTNFNFAPEQIETPPPPSAVLPFGRDADFVQRGELCDRIQKQCRAPGSRTALVGLGGVGKSQLAIELAYRAQVRSPETWVFWVHASNAARFEQSYRNIANCVRLPGRQNPDADIFQLVHDWLQDKKGKWFLILDNVDDASFLLKRKGSQPLISYVPQCQNGSILITTRSRAVALQLVEQRNVVTVEPMNIEDALALLQRKLENQDCSKEAIELVEVLEFMPLAIVQAAAYISRRQPRYSVQQYLQDFQRNDCNKTSLLDSEGGQLRRDWEAKNSIIITWQISFDYIRQIRPSAANLLALMSFCDRQGIPEALLRDQPTRGTTQHVPKEEKKDGKYDLGGDVEMVSPSIINDGFEDDILTLRDYSFIYVNAAGTIFEMHRLVQLSTRKWLEVHGQLEEWKQHFISNLYNVFPTGEPENWTKCQTLFPHAKSIAGQQPEQASALHQWAKVLYRAAWYAWRINNGIEAEKLSIQAMIMSTKLNGREHNDALLAIAMVGLAYKLTGRWEEAATLFEEVVETGKKISGMENPDTLVSMGNLASTYFLQGRWDAAEALYAEVVETFKIKLGPENHSTLASMADLASMYNHRGRYDAAEALEAKVFEGYKKTLGPEHPDTLIIMFNLASTWMRQGRSAEAIGLMRECVHLRYRILGVSHPYYLTSSEMLDMWEQGGRTAALWANGAG